jgi:hypothetical protein
MDDITALREVRAQRPGPSAAETSAARNALLAAIAATEHSASGQARPRAGATWRSLARWRVVIPAAAAAVLVAALMPVLVSAGSARHVASSPSEHPVPAAPSAQPHNPTYRQAALTAAVVLRSAADAAAHQALATGRYLFTESEVIGAVQDGNSAPVLPPPYLRKTWLGDGVDGQLIQPSGPGEGAASLPPGVDVGASRLTWAQVRGLPTSQPALQAIVVSLAAGMYPKHPDAVAFSEFQAITALLFESPTPPAVAAVLYRLAASLPGIKVVDTTDLVGRAAVEVYMEPGRNGPAADGAALFFDPARSALLGWADISASGPQCPVAYEAAILATGYVGSQQQVPPGTPTSMQRAYYSLNVRGCPGYGANTLPSEPAPAVSPGVTASKQLRSEG